MWPQYHGVFDLECPTMVEVQISESNNIATGDLSILDVEFNSGTSRFCKSCNSKRGLNRKHITSIKVIDQL